MSTKRSAKLAAFLVLCALPLALRLVPIFHGDERNYVPDSSMARAALGMARDHDLLPPVGKFSYYPNLMPYLLLPIYGVQFLIGIATDAWGSIQEFGQHMLAHPQHAAWPARALVAVFGALTTWIVWRAALAAGMKHGAWVAAWLVGTGLLGLQLSTHERPWVPVVCFMAASAWAAIEYSKQPTLRLLALSGVMAGLSMAAHTSGLGALAIPGLAWACGPLAWKGPALRARLLQGVVAVGLFLAVGMLLGHAYMFKHGWTTASSAIGGEEIAKAGGLHFGGVSIVPEIRLESVPRLARALIGYDPVVVLLGLAGLVLALRDRRLRAIAIFTLMWAGIFLTNRSDHVRYLLPVTVLLALPAGLVAERWASKPFGRMALLVLLAFPLLQALRFDWVMLQPDTRAEAEAKLSLMPSGSCTAIDRYGPEVDLDKAGIYRLATLRNTRKEALRAREEFRKRELDSGLATSLGVDAVRIEELFETSERDASLSVKKGLEELGATPHDVLLKLGVTHVLEVDRRPLDVEGDHLFGLLPPGSSVWIVDPAGARGPASEAFLPTEMDFPLTGLWNVERPGPRLELVKLLTSPTPPPPGK